MTEPKKLTDLEIAVTISLDDFGYIVQDGVSKQHTFKVTRDAILNAPMNNLAHGLKNGNWVTIDIVPYTIATVSDIWLTPAVVDDPGYIEIDDYPT